MIYDLWPVKIFPQDHLAIRKHLWPHLYIFVIRSPHWIIQNAHSNKS